MRRFLGFVVLPALATLVVVIQTAQTARDERLDAYLSRIGGLVATVVQDDPTAGRALLERVGAESPVEIGLYRGGVRVPPPPAGAVGLPLELPTTPGWHPEVGLWMTPVGSAFEETDARFHVAVRPVGRRRAAASTRTVIATFTVFALALLSAWIGLGARHSAAEAYSHVAPIRAGNAARTRARRTGARGRGLVMLGLSLAVAGTGVVAGGVAVAEERLLRADATRELTTVAALVTARDALDDPAAAQRWIGSPVLRIEGAGVRTGDGSPPPSFAGRLPQPAPGFPRFGSTRDTVWLVATSETGRTVFFSPSPRMPPLLALAALGTLVVLAGAVRVGRSASVDEFVRA